MQVEKKAYERFTMFDNWGEIFDELDDGDAIALFRAMYRYAFGNEEPEFPKGSALSITWKAIKPNIDSSGKAASNGSGKGRGSNPKKTPPETPSETPPETPPETPSEQKKGKEGKRKGKEGDENFSLEKNSHPPVAADGAAVAGATPPAAPVCPMCHGHLEKTGMPDPDFWWCDSCKDGYPRGKAAFEEVSG